MGLVEILAVEPASVDPELLAGFALDAPTPGWSAEIHAFPTAGWVVGTPVPASAVELVFREQVIRVAAVGGNRPDVAAVYPDVPAADRSGFTSWVGTLGLSPEFELRVRVLLEDQRRVDLGVIRGRRRPLRTGFEPGIQPLLLTSPGRTGTTWLMRLLAEHPRIVAFRDYPYEVWVARYWQHMLKVLSDPADWSRSAHPESFPTDWSWVGHNPYYPTIVERLPGVTEWLGQTYLEQLGAFSQRSSEECYRRIAAAQGQADVAYFVEKHRPDLLPWLVGELYPNVREVFLVRDFRDLVSSVLAFNARRGNAGFGRNLVETDEAYVRQLRRGPLERLRSSWEGRRHQAHLVRYEDLVLHPVATLEKLLRYLDLDHDGACIEGMLKRAGVETPELRQHRTSSDPAASIGRWRLDLDPKLQEVCRDVFADVLEQFGYAL